MDIMHKADAAAAQHHGRVLLTIHYYNVCEVTTAMLPTLYSIIIILNEPGRIGGV